MIKVRFKDLEPSDFLSVLARERVQSVIEKFEDTEAAQVAILLAMDNSPRKPGPDLFTAQVRFCSGRYRGLVLKKSDQTLHGALADLVDHMLEVLNRYGDRSRVKQIKQSRALRRKKAS